MCSGCTETVNSFLEPQLEHGVSVLSGFCCSRVESRDPLCLRGCNIYSMMHLRFVGLWNGVRLQWYWFLPQSRASQSKDVAWFLFVGGVGEKHLPFQTKPFAGELCRVFPACELGVWGGGFLPFPLRRMKRLKKERNPQSVQKLLEGWDLLTREVIKDLMFTF